jgi:hypothetical protein
MCIDVDRYIVFGLYRDVRRCMHDEMFSVCLSLLKTQTMESASSRGCAHPSSPHDDMYCTACYGAVGRFSGGMVRGSCSKSATNASNGVGVSVALARDLSCCADTD